MAQALLQLKNVCKYYVNGNNVVSGLTQANLSMYRGEFVAITGESGSGKSTLGHIISGILPYEDGEMYFNGYPTSHYDNADWEKYRKDHISFISQSYGILPGVTVLDHIVSALRLCGENTKDAKKTALEILEQVELSDVAHRRAAKLSSGQKQRLSIARAMAKPCDILIADEPTGNLDAENSEKVIRLLAQAAQERLVIIITHEYSEVADYVTRHVRLQDSLVSGDFPLRAKAVCSEPPKQERPRRRLAPYLARIQLRSRPMWTSAVLLFFALTAFTVFVFLGSFIVALDDTSTRIYEPTAFRNGNKERIVVVRADGADMTQADYDALLELKYVTYLDRYSYAADISYSYQLGVDYEFNYITRNIGSMENPIYFVQEIPQVKESEQYVQTIPLLPDDEVFLTAGREPENFYEVVIVGDSDRIGESFDVYLCDFGKMSYGDFLVFHMTVVGTTDLGSGLYFHEDVGKMLTRYYDSGVCKFPVSDPVYSEITYHDYRDISGILFQTDCTPTENAQLRPILDSDVFISHEMYIYYSYRIEFVGSKYEALYTHFGVVGIHDSTYRDSFGISATKFQNWVDQMAYHDQVSLYIKDYAYTQRVIDALAEEGYLAISPYKQGSAKIDPDLAAKRVQTLIISISALAAVVLLQLIVLRALFGMEHESYRTLSTVGLPYKTAKNSLLLQILGFAMVGQLLGLGAVLICSRMDVQRILAVTKYLSKPYWLLLSAVHLLASAAVAAIAVSSLRKRVYPISTKQTDLELEEEAEV